MDENMAQDQVPISSKFASERTNVGKAVLRLEDLKIVKGIRGYTDDIEFADQHYAAILHSPYAHAKILKIDVSKAIQLPGVLLVLTGKEIKSLTNPVSSRAAKKSPTSHYILAVDKVRYMGEPVALVVAKTKYIATDAVNLIDVEYEPLPVVSSIEAALKKDAPLIYPELGSNELIYDHFEFGDVNKAFKEADKIVKQRFNIQRYASTPLEPWVVNAYFDRTRDELIVYANDQQPGRTVQSVEKTINIPSSRIRLIVPPVGGGFGNKLAIWPYVALIGLSSKLCGKPVKWVQTRMENLYAFHRPRGFMDAEFAMRKDGKILGVKLSDWQADGNWPYVAGLYSLIKFANMSGTYEIRNLSYEYRSVVTNDPPVTQDRGVGKPFMSFVLERMMDIAADELNIDRIAIREKNLIPPEKMPYTTASGEVYESGNYPETLRRALKLSGYYAKKKEQEKLRKEGRYVGIGLSEGIEPGTSNLGYYFLSKTDPPDYNGAGQMSTVEIAPDGIVKVNMNAPEIGTGHVTTIAQAVSDVFGVKPDEVVVDASFDSTLGHLTYAGTYSNLFNDVCLGAVMKASERLKSKALSIASSILKEPKELLFFKDGYVCKNIENPQMLLSLKELAKISYGRLLSFPKNEEPGLRVTAAYVDPIAKPFTRSDFNIQLTHSNSVHVCYVEVFPENWNVKILDYTIVHDVGNMINPGIVEGLVIGSTVSGIGGAMYEEFVFDNQDINLSLTFGDYLKPTSTEVPDFRIGQMESPAPNTVFGTKAAGEGGAITSLAAVASAIEDALKPFNVRITELPITPEKIWKWVKETEEFKKINREVH
ncbi:MAG: xanthine dehydrogenase family protein molybdopterin-binding subunit [Thermoplasmatales archaeon]